MCLGLTWNGFLTRSGVHSRDLFTWTCTNPLAPRLHDQSLAGAPLDRQLLRALWQDVAFLRNASWALLVTHRRWSRLRASVQRFSAYEHQWPADLSVSAREAASQDELRCRRSTCDRQHPCCYRASVFLQCLISPVTACWPCLDDEMPEREAAVNGSIADTTQIAVIDQRQPEHSKFCAAALPALDQCPRDMDARQADRSARAGGTKDANDPSLLQRRLGAASRAKETIHSSSSALRNS